MREASDWLEQLSSDLEAEGFLVDGMSAAEFCRAELGLHFLARYFPGEPSGILQPVLSGYVQTDPGVEAAARRVRHRMGDVSRRGYWRKLLNVYTRVPDSVRAFRRTDDPRRRVTDATVFVPAPSSVCPHRGDVYDAALTDSLPYRQHTQHPPAEAGKRYRFESAQGTQYVQLPDSLPEAGPLPLLTPAPSRDRQPWPVSFGKHLTPTAEWIDEKLKDKPHIRNRNWEGRLADLRFQLADPGAGKLIDKPDEFSIDGIEHLVGLMNSGKTTLADLITVHGTMDPSNTATTPPKRICLVVSSVGDVLAKVSFLKTLGIKAVPLIGRSSRGEHAARYWRTRIDEAAVLVPDSANPADPAAAYVNTSCLLEPFRQTMSPEWEPLAVKDFPCQGSLREADTDAPWRYDCPLLSICPAQKALREVADAQVWVTTPQCLVATRAAPATAQMRWLEQVQHDMDLMVIDEADAVQQVLDHQFLQEEELVSGENGWTHRMARYTNDALARTSLAPAAYAEVQQWHEYLQIHQQAVFALYQLALSSDGEELRELLGTAPFTAHSLFRQAARMLHGLPRTGEGDKHAEDAAEDYYQRHLQDFAEGPLDETGHGLADVVAELTRLRRNDEAIRTALDKWIDAEATKSAKKDNRIEPVRSGLRLVTEAGIWAGRITYSFFEMTTMYPSVRDILQLPDEETFWVDQPPRDYRPLVPEAPIGNILALRWAPVRGGGASLQLLWVHGVGRWLLHHGHDLLSCEGTDGPHVILTSATSWIPGSSFYHVPVVPSAVLAQPDDDRKALMTSTMTVQPGKAAGTGAPIFVSGRPPSKRDDALRQMVTYLCEAVEGRHRSLIEELREELPEGRKQILFVVLSGADAEVVSEAINNRTRYRARNLVPDAADPGKDGILRRLVADFGTGTDDILVAAEMAIQRGYNILNSSDTAALGAVIYLARSHPPPADLAFPLSLVSQLAMRYLMDPLPGIPGETDAAVRAFRKHARGLWFGVIGRPVRFRTLDDDRLRTAFVANNLVPMSQTIGRSIRGNQPTRVLLCDAAFAERLATGDTVPDTARTSLVVATDALLGRLLAKPGEDAPESQKLEHAINEATWDLLGHLVRTNIPLGSQRR